MAMEYRFTYKCRLCGKEFDNAKTGNKEVAKSELMLFTAEYSSAYVTRYFPHYCNDNDIGIADFIGVKGIKCTKN